MAANIFDRISGIKQLEEDVTGDPNGYIGKNSRAICDSYQTDPNNSAFNGPGGGALRGSLDRMCKPYYDEIGEPPVEGVPPFEGGQCPGVMYVWESQQLNNATCSLEDIQNSTPREGPIVLVSTSSSNLSTIDGCQGRSYTSIFTAGTATFAVQRRGLPDSAPTVRWVRADGQPDECGDPPPQFEPNPSYPTPRPWGVPTIPGTDPSGSPYTYTPRRDPATGTPWIEIDGPEGPVGLPPFGGDRPDMTEPPVPPSLGPAIDVDGSGEVDADPEDELDSPALLGYRFTVRDDAPQFQSVIPGTNPAIYSRIVGSLQLILRGENGTFYSDNLQITSQEGSIVKQHPTLQVVGCVYNVLPNLAGLTLREIRGKDDDS